MVLDKNSRTTDFDFEFHGTYFQDPDSLVEILRDRTNFQYDDACFGKLREFVTKVQASDFSKSSLFKCLHSFLAELYRKLNVRNTMSRQYAHIGEIRNGIDSNFFSIRYSEQFIKDR